MKNSAMLWLSVTLGAFCLMVMGGVAALVILPNDTSTQTAALSTNTAVSPVSPIAAPTTSLTSAKSTAYLDTKTAEQIAMVHHPQATVSQPPELVNYNGLVAYEVILNTGKVYIAADSGDVLNPPQTMMVRQSIGDAEDDEYEQDEYDEYDEGDETSKAYEAQYIAANYREHNDDYYEDEYDDD